MDTFPKSLNLLPSLTFRWSITFRTARRGCCCDKAMMAPPLINNVCALFSPTIEETVPHPIYIIRGHIHHTMGEEKDQNRAQSSRVHTLVHHICNEKCELVHFSNGIPSVVSNQISLMSLYNSTRMSHREGSLSGNISSPTFFK